MSYQRMIPLGLAVTAGVANGIYVFKPYLEGQDEVGKLDLPNSSVGKATPLPSSAIQPPQQPNSDAQPAATESTARR